MKWRVPGFTNSNAALAMAPRVSMIAGIDTLGNAYITLTQTNTNAQVMGMYFKFLSAKLDKERPNWRWNTIILMDGASYHQDQDTL